MSRLARNACLVASYAGLSICAAPPHGSLRPQGAASHLGRGVGKARRTLVRLHCLLRIPAKSDSPTWTLPSRGGGKPILATTRAFSPWGPSRPKADVHRASKGVTEVGRDRLRCKAFFPIADRNNASPAYYVGCARRFAVRRAFALRHSEQAMPSSICPRTASPIQTRNPTEADPNSFAGKSVHLRDDHRLANGVTDVVGIALPLWQFNDWMLDLAVIEQAEQMMNAI